MRRLFLLTVVVLGTALLTACTNPIRPARDEWPRIGDEFAQALRWGDYPAAASYLFDEQRETFTQYFPDDGLLRLLDVRHEASGAPEEAVARGRLVLEYYRAPSVTVKKITLPVEWNCINGTRIKPCSWRLTVAPGPLP